MEEKVRFKYPHIACEILTSEVFSITEKLCENEVSILDYIVCIECTLNFNVQIRIGKYNVQINVHL